MDCECNLSKLFPNQFKFNTVRHRFRNLMHIVHNAYCVFLRSPTTVTLLGVFGPFIFNKNKQPSLDLCLQVIFDVHLKRVNLRKLCKDVVAHLKVS